MPKRSLSYRTWLGEKLTDAKVASRYLNAARKDSPEMFFKALRRVSESRQMAKVAENAGVSRESLYRMTSASGNPTYSSLDGILKALALDLSIVPLVSVTEIPSGNPEIAASHWRIAGFAEDRKSQLSMLGSEAGATRGALSFERFGFLGQAGDSIPTFASALGTRSGIAGVDRPPPPAALYQIQGANSKLSGLQG